MIASGQNSVAGITPSSGWTQRAEVDIGSQVSGLYTNNTVDSSDVTCGFTQTSEDYAVYGVGIKEATIAAKSLFPKRAASPFIHMMVR
jgi:hypothetical protein